MTEWVGDHWKESNFLTGLDNAIAYQTAGGMVCAGSHYSQSSAQSVSFIRFLIIRGVSRISLKIFNENWSTYSTNSIEWLYSSYCSDSWNWILMVFVITCKLYCKELKSHLQNTFVFFIETSMYIGLKMVHWYCLCLSMIYHSYRNRSIFRDGLQMNVWFLKLVIIIKSVPIVYQVKGCMMLSILNDNITLPFSCWCWIYSVHFNIYSVLHVTDIGIWKSRNTEMLVLVRYTLIGRYYKRWYTDIHIL